MRDLINQIRGKFINNYNIINNSISTQSSITKRYILFIRSSVDMCILVRIAKQSHLL